MAGGLDRRRQMPDRIVTAHRQVVNACPGCQPVALECRFRDNQQRRRSVAGLAGDRGGDIGVLRIDRLERGHFFQRAVTRCFIGADAFERHDFPAEMPRLYGSQRPPMAFQGKVFHLAAVEAPMPGDALGGIELVHRLVAEACLPAAAAGERITEAQRLPGQHRRGNGNLRHGLYTTDGHHVLGAAHHRLGGEMQRLLGRTALTVDRGAGYVQRQAGRQPRGAGDVTRLRADGVDTAKNHIVIVFGGNGITFDK